MSALSSSESPAAVPAPRSRRAAVAALVVLSPVISELLYGGTRISYLFALVPEIMVWGCGTLLIREVVRQRRRGWISMGLLALALAVAEECVIQQTSMAPLAGLARQAYGRVGGVNWVYFLWAVVYESVWVVLVPIQLIELMFPGIRGRPWLRPRGRWLAGACLALGSLAAWYSWTQQARVKVFHMAPYSLPVSHLAAALVVIAGLIIVALPGPGSPAERPTRGGTAPAPGTVGIAAGVLGSPWGAFVLMGFGAFPAVPWGLAFAGGLAWAGLAILLVRRWAIGRGWSDRHRFALVLGAVVACMLGGFVVFAIGGALRIDWVGKGILDLAAVLWLASLGRSIGRPAPVETMP